MKDEFVCSNCGREVKLAALGTKHRNHCPYCLWSVHLDRDLPGDRMEDCGGLMEAVGLSSKNESDETLGELMLVHRCLKCGVVRKNRIAGDDEVESILAVFENSLDKQVESEEVRLLAEPDRHEIMVQLFGKSKV